MSQLTRSVLSSALRVTAKESTIAVCRVTQICVANNKDCSFKCTMENKIPSYVTGRFGWKCCKECQEVKMELCCNDKCVTNDAIKRTMTDEIKKIERMNIKFVERNGKVICDLCGMLQPQLDDLIHADLSIEDESGNRFFDDESAQTHGMGYGVNTKEHKRHEYLVDGEKQEKNKVIARYYLQHKRKYNEASKQVDNTEQQVKKEIKVAPSSQTSTIKYLKPKRKAVDNVQTETTRKETTTSISSNTTSATTTTKPTTVACFRYNHHELAFTKTMSERKEEEEKKKLEDSTAIQYLGNGIILGVEHITNEIAQKAVLDNINSPIREKYEFDMMKEIDELVSHLKEDGLCPIDQILVKDVDLPAKAAKWASYMTQYMKVVLEYKTAPSNRRLRIALAITREFCARHPTFFVSYQRIYDVCFNYHIKDYIEECYGEKEEDNNSITMFRYLTLCKQLNISYTLDNILTHNFLTSASIYLINKFVVHVNNEFTDEKDAKKRITAGNMKTLQKRSTDQIRLYLELVNKELVKAQFDAAKPSKSKVSRSSDKEDVSLSLDLSIIIPAIILVMACEQVLTPCKYQVTGIIMSKIIGISDTKLSSVKLMILQMKAKDVATAQKNNYGLHKKKASWVLPL